MEENLKPQLIAIDGPVAVGKSSVGSLLAKRLGYVFFDTGMIYRAFTWKVLKSGISPEDKEKLCELATTTEFDFVPSKEGALSVFIDGEDVSSKLLRPEIEGLVALIAKVAEVRQTMVSQQRKLAQRGKVIMAGRDIGTVVLPSGGTEDFSHRLHRRESEAPPQGATETRREFEPGNRPRRFEKA